VVLGSNPSGVRPTFFFLLKSQLSNHVNHGKLCHEFQIMLFMSNHAIHVKLCKVMSNHVIYVKSCHSCQIMSFMSNYVSHVKSCHSCQIMSFMSNHVMSPWYFSYKLSIKLGRGISGEGQICLPRPSATASLSGRRQKVAASQLA
jgi:hypothetical protein